MNLRNFFKGEERTIRAKKNIVASVFLKGIDGIVYLLLVPVTLGYLNQYEYGIWLTLNSILMWINSFDIGLGNGMRNRLAEAIAKGDKELGRIYVSTTFFMLIGLMGILIVLGTICEPFIDWYGILSTTPNKVTHLDEVVYVSFAIFCLNFIFKFIGNVYLAMQLPAVNNLMNVSGHLLSLIIIYVLTICTNGSLLWIAIVYSGSPLLVYLLAYPITFFKVFPFLKPSFSAFKSKYLKSLLDIGLRFFLIQLSAILLFAFANILISHMFGPENVTPYNIAYRYFSLVPMAMSLILAPMWSATTDAYTKGDIKWIRHTVRNINKILVWAFIVIIVMVIISEPIYNLWVGSKVNIPFVLSFFMGIYVAIIIYSLAYSNFLNGLGRLRLQTINTIVVAILFLPTCYFLGHVFGIVGIILGMCILNLSGLILNKIQFKKIINNTATGIWNE